MTNCARELKDAIPTVSTCPAVHEVVMFITSTGYVGREWEKLIDCISEAVLPSFDTPDDIEITIDSGWAGRNYYDYPNAAGKRFRLFRQGILLNKNQWRPLVGGGWQLLTPNDQQFLNQVFTIAFY